MRHLLLVCWGYVIEIGLAGVVYALLIAAFGSDAVAHFFAKTWIAWLTVSGLVFAAAFAMLILVVQMMTSEFGCYLTARSKDGTFKNAYGFAIFASSASVIAFILSGNIKSNVLSHASGFLLLVVVVNIYTMVVNIFNLQRMHALFEKIRRHGETSQPMTTDDGSKDHD